MPFYKLDELEKKKSKINSKVESGAVAHRAPSTVVTACAVRTLVCPAWALYLLSERR